MRNLLAWLSFFGLFGVMSCNDKVVVKQSQSIPQVGWSYQDTAKFSFEIEDTLPSYKLMLNVKLNKDTFSFENFYCKIITELPKDSINTQIVSFELLNKDAQGETECSGSNCTIPILLADGFKFPQQGKYSLQFAQESREQFVKGIYDLELIITSAKIEN